MVIVRPEDTEIRSKKILEQTRDFVERYLEAEHLLNETSPSLLHELGHHCLRVESEIDPKKLVNHFAGAFALPAAVLRDRLGATRGQLHPVELIGLKKEFGLSIADPF